MKILDEQLTEQVQEQVETLVGTKTIVDLVACLEVVKQDLLSQLEQVEQAIKNPSLLLLQTIGSLNSRERTELSSEKYWRFLVEKYGLIKVALVVSEHEYDGNRPTLELSRVDFDSNGDLKLMHEQNQIKLEDTFFGLLNDCLLTGATELEEYLQEKLPK